MAAPPIGLTLTTTCRQRCLRRCRRRRRCDWAKNRKRWLLTARANRKHSKAAVCGEQSSAQCTQTTHTQCVQSAVRSVYRRVPQQLGNSQSNEGGWSWALLHYRGTRRGAKDLLKATHRGLQWGLHIFSRYRTGGSQPGTARAHTPTWGSLDYCSRRT